MAARILCALLGAKPTLHGLGQTEENDPELPWLINPPDVFKC
jgi:hypothetical protein